MDKTLYEVLGEDRIRALVDRFYDHMDRSPAASALRALHPPELTTSRDKLFWFLVGWSGGPPLYVSRFGHPRLRARHLPFPIGPREARQWMDCMRAAMAEVIHEPQLRSRLEASFAQIAEQMENAADDDNRPWSPPDA